MDDMPERMETERGKTQADRDRASVRLAKVVADYDPALLAAALAALTIRPENADFGFRIESMIDLVASRPGEGELSPTIKKIRGLCTSNLSFQLVAPLEDPAEHPVTQVLVFDGHAYTAFAGQESDLVFGSERLFAAISGLAADRVDLNLRPTLNLIKAVLVLGAAIAERSGAGPDMPAIHQNQIFVPGTDLDELVRPVRWSHSELDALLLGAGIPGAVLDPLCQSLGSLPKEQFTPLLAGDGEVVVRPGRLLFGLCRAVLGAAEAAGLLPLVTERFGSEVHAEMVEAVLGMGVRPMQIPASPLKNEPTVSEAMFALDDDAVMVLMTITDRIEQLDPADAEGGHFPSEGLKETLARRLEDLVGQVQGEILICVCTALLPGVSYWLHDFKVKGDAELLFLTPEALLVIARLERDPLALVRFAKTRRALRASAPVIVWDDLDEFAVYRKHGHSFHLTEESASPAVSILPGWGLDLRQEMLDKLERQSATAPSGGVEVELVLASYRGVPIFAPRISPGQSARVVRFPRLDIWVAGEHYEDLPESLIGTCEELTATAAYWTWQAASAIIDLAPPRDGWPRTIVIGLALTEPENWTPDRIPTEDLEDRILARHRTDSEVILWLQPSLLRAMAGPDNGGERHFARAIAGSLIEMLAPEERHGGRLDEIVELIAPVGPRKMMLIGDDHTASMLGPGDGLSDWHRVSQWDLGQVLDELAGAFRAAGLAPRPSGTRDEQNSLLNFAVEFCYQRLEAGVAELAPDGLLEDLLRRNEALLLARARHALLVVTKPACFGARAEVLEPLVREELEWNDADATNRFLIEYLAARPPGGSRTLSQARYDRLIALTLLIFQYGIQSDITKHEIDNLEVRVAPSGRLQASPGKYAATTLRWLSGITGRKLRSAAGEFAEHWEPPHEGPVVAEPNYETAFLAEYGFSATHLGDVFYVLRDLASDGEGSLALRARAGLIAECVQMRQVPAETVDLILAVLTLEPRANFLKPPTPFAREDVYPWRFSRDLSLLARPLVRRGDNLVWGRRAVNLSAQHLLQQLATGRLRASSLLMQNLRSDISRASGKAFEAKVATRVAELGLPVKARATKVSGIRISVPKGTLGDVDVLAADANAKVIWAIECKAFAMARTPWEIRQELMKFINPRTGVAAHHIQRVQWLRTHMTETLGEFGIDSPKGWRVEPLIVLEADLLAAHLHDSPIPIIDLPGLAGALHRGKPPIPTTASA
jgi:hypothetical protein